MRLAVGLPNHIFSLYRLGTGERAGSGSPFTPVSYSDDREASDSDKDLMEKKRMTPTARSCQDVMLFTITISIINLYVSLVHYTGKKNAASSGAPSNGNGNGGSHGNADYSTPNSTKVRDPIAVFF